jgi:hypothetical protein
MSVMTSPSQPSVPWRTRLACGVLLLVAALPGALAQADEGRAAIPDPAARANAGTELKKEHRTGYESKDPEVRRTLARTLLERANAAEVDAVHRYVLLDQAVALAEGVRDVRLALEAVDRLAVAFQVEAAPRGLLALENVTRGAKDMSVVAEAATACVEMVGVALSADDAGSAVRAVGMAKTLAKTAKPFGARRARDGGRTFVDAYRKSSGAAVAARKVLEATPTIPVRTRPSGASSRSGGGAMGRACRISARRWCARRARGEGGRLRRGRNGAPGGRRRVVGPGAEEKDGLARARMRARRRRTSRRRPRPRPSERRS